MIAKLWQNEEEVTETWLNGMEKRKETQWLFQLIKLFFFIRNEEDYINKRTNTEEKKETKEREKNQGKDERSFLHNNQGKHPTIVI